MAARKSEKQGTVTPPIRPASSEPSTSERPSAEDIDIIAGLMRALARPDPRGRPANRAGSAMGALARAAARDLDHAQENLADIFRLIAEAKDLATSILRNSALQNLDVADHMRVAALASKDWCGDDSWVARDAAAAEVQALEARLAA